MTNLAITKLIWNNLVY